MKNKGNMEHTSSCTLLFVSMVAVDHVQVFLAAICDHPLCFEWWYEETSVGDTNNAFLQYKLNKVGRLC